MIKMGKKRKWYKIEAQEKNVKLAIKKKKKVFLPVKTALTKTGLIPLQMLYSSCIMPGMPLSR